MKNTYSKGTSKIVIMEKATKKRVFDIKPLVGQHLPGDKSTGLESVICFY